MDIPLCARIISQCLPFSEDTNSTPARACLEKKELGARRLRDFAKRRFRAVQPASSKQRVYLATNHIYEWRDAGTTPGPRLKHSARRVSCCYRMVTTTEAGGHHRMSKKGQLNFSFPRCLSLSRTFFFSRFFSNAVVRSTPVWLARQINTQSTSAISSARFLFLSDSLND